MWVIGLAAGSSSSLLIGRRIRAAALHHQARRARKRYRHLVEIAWRSDDRETPHELHALAIRPLPPRDRMAWPASSTRQGTWGRADAGSGTRVAFVGLVTPTRLVRTREDDNVQLSLS